MVEKREMKQWFLRITRYAEKLLDGLKHLPEWPDMVKVQQENWIGKSTGAEIEFEIRNQKSEIRSKIKVFTTRPDTIFGATYLVVAPEHRVITDYELRITNWKEVEEYITAAKKKSELARLDATKEKTGVEMEGVRAINPATGEEIPVWVSDYVLGNYGTGAIMAVPAHDERDFAFAKRFGLPVKVVVHPENNVNAEGQEKYLFKDDVVGYIQNYGNYSGNGVLINSGKFSGMKSEEAIPKMAAEFGKPTTQYKLRDWLFSRQRYWGEPIPIVHCACCASAVSRKQKAENRKDAKAEFYFPGDAYFADIARGYKTVETRSFDPSGENKAWAEIEVGDTVSIYNKKSKKKFLAEVEEIRLFKNFLELYKAKDWLEKIFPGKKFKNPIEVELAYKKIYKGYPEQVRRFGLAAWKLKIQTVPVAVKEKDLPLKLPQVKKYEPTGTGESPLAQVESWVNTVCPILNCTLPSTKTIQIL
jgi:leucyl-tRNA synthetase